PRPVISTLFPYTTLFRSFFLGDKPVDDVAVFTLEPEKYAEMLFDGLRRVQLGGQCDEGIVITNPYFCISVACVESRTDGRPRHGDRKSTRLNSSHVKISY